MPMLKVPSPSAVLHSQAASPLHCGRCCAGLADAKGKALACSWQTWSWHKAGKGSQTGSTPKLRPHRVQAVKCLVFLAPSLEASLEPGRQSGDGAQAHASAASPGAGEDGGPDSEAGEATEHAAATQDEDGGGGVGVSDDEEDEENTKLDRHAEAGVSLAGLIRRMTRAAGNRQYAGAQRRLVALRFVAGRCLFADHLTLEQSYLWTSVSLCVLSTL